MTRPSDAEIVAAAKVEAMKAREWGVRWSEDDFVEWLRSMSGFGLTRAEAQRLAKMAAAS